MTQTTDMVSANVPSPSDVQQTLGAIAPTTRRWRGRLVAVALLAVVLVLVLLWARSRQTPPGAQYQMATVTRGSLVVTVTATGSLESLTEVSVGTEISGVVDTVRVDYNTAVRRGDLLATINTDKLRAQADQSRAALDAARANKLQADATLTEARAQLARLQSVRELSGGRVPSQQEYDTQVASTMRAEADQASAAAQVTQAEASLAATMTDIRKAEIRSPINGIVLDRQVDPGQTVAATYQTPTLFTLAEDLTRMKLIVDVDEADIGQVQVGQPAIFRVDAYSNRKFESHVTEVRSTPTTSSGVVTYQTVLSVDNAERLLRPGMTATADITVTRVDEATLVPNAALRFVPPSTDASNGSSGFSLFPRPPTSSRAVEPVNTDPAKQRVWVLRNDEPTPLTIGVGVTDGSVTQVVSGDLQAGTSVIVDTTATE